MPTEYCRHIHVNGRRCQSPALRDKAYCYFHIRNSQRHRTIDIRNLQLPESIPDHHRNVALLKRDPLMAQYYGVDKELHGPLALDLPALEDRDAIQVAISLVVAALGHNRLDPRRANSILYALQIASNNAAGLKAAPSHIVREVNQTEEGADIALDEDPEEIQLANELLDSLEQEEDDEDDED